MVKIYCEICKEMICKYEIDFNSCGGIYVDIGKNENVKEIEVCYDCAKAITKQFVDEA